MSDLLKKKNVTVLTLAAAKAIADAAAAEGVAAGWPAIAVAVVDAGGNLLYFARHEDCGLGGIRGAIYKAETALRFSRPTKQLAESGRTHYFAFPHALPVEGGIPIVVDGALIGAVGVGGTTTEGSADRCAKAGLTAIGA